MIACVVILPVAGMALSANAVFKEAPELVIVAPDVSALNSAEPAAFWIWKAVVEFDEFLN
jgi:hypothetical protein